MEKKIKFNFIDVCIILVVIAAIVVVGIMYSSKTETVSIGSDGELYFTVLVTETDEAYTKAITVDDMVIFGTSSSDSAVVTAIDIQPAVNHVKNLETGGYENAVIEDRYDVYVTLKGSAIKGENSFDIGTTDIRTGEIFEGKGKSSTTEKAYLVKGYVIDMSMN